jgi:Xaa-Pro aminopeptidase
MLLVDSMGLEARLARVRQTMAERRLDALIVTHRPNVFYLTNFASSSAIVVLTDRRVYLLADPRYTTALNTLRESASAPPSSEAVLVEGSYDEALAGWLLTHAAGWRVGFEAGDISVKRHRWLLNRLTRAARGEVGTAGTGAATERAGGAGSGIELVPTEDVIETYRESKDHHEIGVLREGARRLSGVARTLLARGVEAGVTEAALAAEIDHRMRLAGFERPAFDTIVAGGPNSALPHAVPTDRPFAPGDLVVLDFGGVYSGYCVDLTRTVVVGEGHDEARRLYGAVAEAQDAALAALRPGITADVVDAAARDVLTRHGLGEVFGHGTGHGLGLEIHESPRLGRRRPDAPEPSLLRAGMVVTIEPGAYVPGLGGVRIEDDALVTDTGAELLTDVPRDGRLL